VGLASSEPTTRSSSTTKKEPVLGTRSATAHHQSRWSVGRNRTSLTFIRPGWARVQRIPWATSSALRNSMSLKESSMRDLKISGSTWDPSSDSVGPGSNSVTRTRLGRTSLRRTSVKAPRPYLVAA
jgi:hypothetical protein